MSYSVSLSKLLEGIGAKEGSKLSVASKGKTYTGILMPHHDFSGKDIIVLKLSSGYNVGVKVEPGTEIKVLGQQEPRRIKESKEEGKPGLPKISFIGTGGTIASNTDYRTGALHPALSASEIVDIVPGLRDVANISAKMLFSVFSENMSVEHWQKLAEAVASEINGGADAVIILHGTDTMGYTAAALSFMLGDVPKPVVLVGAQRSPDRPSSDAPSNILAAARFCVSGRTAGVFVVMHKGLGDDLFAVHAGTRVRKMHTSRRDAFESINVPPVAIVDENGKIEFKMKGKDVTSEKVVAKTKMERSTILLQYYPGMDPALFEGIMMKSKGIVISGTGLGHVGESMVPLIKKACDNGSVVVITSQCLNGRTNLNVYDTGRDMLTAGAIAVLDMLPETAYVKLMWALANSKNAEGAKKLMMAPIAEEMGDRRFVDE
ncbi:glutamyl-tRNA(Gln) amidotransferase subunit D [Candidatus Methanoplasma termitum]|uniref:Glutamyl-tRNA(Gln) amidotransferase subunit D n=1 Tax=Candidatus Methanoplasma termitum TaxID=1577791 RepID=A0A0A7LE23_9ARCH|nr:Glu-tRNA(Gln) amidotransferase subunit GatD [Candidatus Methanoplasma termitum]AIZ57233.1 glutamyl-tRNA(Gln) amidotransferase subunit D [Candidatus Methanoplasma termitum]